MSDARTLTLTHPSSQQQSDALAMTSFFLLLALCLLTSTFALRHGMFHKALLQRRHEESVLSNDRENPSLANNSQLKNTLKYSIVLILTYSIFTPNVNAAIPSMDEFYVKSGTVVRPKIDLTPMSDPLALTNSPLPSAISKSKSIAADIVKALKAKEWTKVFDLGQSLEKFYSKRFFGMDSLGSMQKELALSKDAARELESLREEASFNVAQLNDLARRNKVDFFNKEDLKAVQQLVAETGGVDDPDSALSEATGLIEDIIDGVDKLNALISSCI